jgi:hypothetical protein
MAVGQRIVGSIPKEAKVLFVRAMKAYRESRITAPHILNLATRRGECLT